MQDFDEDGEIKDVFWPDFDPLPGETSIAVRLRFAFSSAGFRAIRIEEVVTHPVVIIKAANPDIRHLTDQRLLARHIRGILDQSGFRPKRDELTVAWLDRRLLVAFQTRKWAPNFEEIMREAADDLAG